MSQIDFAHKTINDPVHGSIKLSKTELSVLDTPTFQRLRGLRQLGLADMVFPGASHTRFAHSLGVLHIVSEMLDAVDRNYRRRTGGQFGPFTDDEKQKIRLAGLLHDVGHLPLSHAMEYPIQRLLSESKAAIVEPVAEIPGRPKSFGTIDDTAHAGRDKGFSHESYGLDILVTREDISQAISEFNENNEIGKIFTKAHIDNRRYSQFITGDLDADRLDFLLRDSLAAGVSYGNVDLKYLLDNIEYDKDKGQFYVAYSGIHAVEHFITSRFFLYNVTYHKTVMGFELLAKHAYYRMAKSGEVDLYSTPDQLRDLLSSENFLSFDDSYFWKKLQEWRPRDIVDRAIRNGLLHRYPMRELFSERELELEDTARGLTPFRVLHEQLYNNAAFDEILGRHSIERAQLAMHTNPIRFSTSPPNKDRKEQPDPAKEWDLCKVYYDDEIRPLIDVPGSIIRTLSFLVLKTRRLYYFPLDPTQQLSRDLIRKDIRSLIANN